MKKLTYDVKHYVPLIGVLLAGLIGFQLFSYDPAFQMALVIAIAAGYVSWGVVHHFLHGDLYLSVILEYLVIAVLGVVIIFSLLLTA